VQPAAICWLAEHQPGSFSESQVKSSREELNKLLAVITGIPSAASEFLENMDHVFLDAAKEFQIGYSLEQLISKIISAHSEGVDREIDYLKSSPNKMQVDSGRKRPRSQETGIPQPVAEPKIIQSFSDAVSASLPSTKRQKISEDPVYSWADVCDPSPAKDTVNNFYSAVDSVRRGVLGLTISNTVLLPKGFDSCFGQVAATLRVLMATLEIKTAESPLFLDSSKYTWVSVFHAPTTENLAHLSQGSRDDKVSTAVLNLFEAVDFITRPHYSIESRPGIDYVRFLMSEAQQDQFENRLPQVEAAFKYTSKTAKVFEDSIMYLTPNVSELPQIIATMLRRIVVSIFSSPRGERFAKGLSLIAGSLYVEDRSIVSKSYNLTVRQRLTAEGKQWVASKKKPQPKHYEGYKSTVKPCIRHEEEPLTTEELAKIKKINQQLQTLEVHSKLPETLNQAVRKRAADLIIKTYHEKCKSIERVYLARRQGIHELLKATRTASLQTRNASASDIAEDRKKPFTTEEWTVATKSYLAKDDSLISACIHEFKLNAMVIDFESINKIILGSAETSSLQ
jgi:hypothetical protein